jgi:ADP-heptose:LPS heptosyltransferase
VFRFSALGDIAMTVPVLNLLLQQHPDIRITMMSVPFVKPLFDGIDRLDFYPVDIKDRYKDAAGIYKLSHRIKKDIRYDAIADLHDVIRTKLLRFFLMGKPIAVINKGRKEKEELTRPTHKKLRPLRSTFQRYANVFYKLGFSIHLHADKGIIYRPADPGLLPRKSKDSFLVGVAPFAKHAAKMYPLDKMKKVVKDLSQSRAVTIILFGGGAAEAEVLKEWEKEISLTNPAGATVFSYAGKLSFADELTVISQLDVMISMDSANMHLASLYGVPVISIWGGTHPWLGFYGWGQPMDNAVQTDLPCRPSSVFGNKDCPVHGKAGCMQEITPGMIVERVKVYGL